MTEVSTKPTESGENIAEQVRPLSLTQADSTAADLPESTTTQVKGRIKVADEVVEKVAALAALEVSGVADMGGDFERALESVRDRIGFGSRRGNQGAQAKISNREVAIDVTIVVEYGYVVMEVAGEVKANVARSVGRMLGLRVIEVNVTVDDVRLPGEAPPLVPDEDGY
jgi:uncharacterized alkaline shock family protein YloU